jgi:hypothetical protein
MLAPSINIKQARSPGHLPGAALIGNCVTGPALCMKNTALCDLIATSENSCTSFRLVRTAISPGKCRVKKPEPGYGVAEVALCAEHHFMGCILRFISATNGDVHHMRCRGRIPVRISCPNVTWIPLLAPTFKIS